MTPITITRTDSRAGRFYTIDGEHYPSVTTILGIIAKPALVPWAANQERTLVLEAAADLYLDLAKTPPMSRPVYLATLQNRLGKTRAHQRALTMASDIGRQTHALIEWTLRRHLGQAVGPEPKVVDDALWAFMAWEDWARSVKLEPLFIEQVVFSRRHGYAGTMDLLARVDNELALIDFKTSKAIYGESFLQNAAYQVALSEMGHATPTAGYIVRMPKTQTDPAFEAKRIPPSAEIFPAFQSALALWKWQFRQEEARVKVA